MIKLVPILQINIPQISEIIAILPLGAKPQTVLQGPFLGPVFFLLHIEDSWNEPFLKMILNYRSGLKAR